MKTQVFSTGKRAVFPGFLAVALSVLLMTGCVAPRHRGVVGELPPKLSTRITQQFPCSLYRLAAGDILEILYLTIPGVTKSPYKLSVRDQLDLEFTYHPELNRTVRVRPDGKISIPRKGDFSVAGKTSEEIRAGLRKVYADLLKDPDITVTVREFNAKLEELQRAIATAPYGQARLVTVAPDGNLAVPFLADVKAQGLTVPQLTDALNKNYSELISDMKVSVLLREVAGNLIFVDGQVNRPGVFNVKGPTTVQHAIALAGGTKDTAEPRTVLVVSRGPDGKFLSRTTDLTRMTSASDYVINQGDLVYVPLSTIARADIWVDQNLKKILLFQGWSVGIDADFGRTTINR